MIEHMAQALTPLVTCTTDVPATEFMALAPRIIDRTVPVNAEVEQIVGRTTPTDVDHNAEIVDRTIPMDER